MEQNITQNTNITSMPELLFNRPLNEKILLVQILVGVFLYVNVLMMFTFFKKEAFRTNTRYILFAQMLFIDSTLMLMTDLALVGNYFQFPFPCIPCIILCFFMNWISFGTPLTLVAMCLERYVAICMPLRHADISNPRTRLVGLILVWCLSCMPALVDLLALVFSAPFSFWFSQVVCSTNIVMLEEWQIHLSAIIAQLYFLGMAAVVTFTYIKIMLAAKAASGNNKKSSSKGLKTVVLHGSQLFLCLIMLWTPYIEFAVMQVDFMVFINVRYSNFILFTIAPRCLSPLVYGLRDEKFFLVLKSYAVFGLNKKVSPVFTNSIIQN